MKKIERVKQAWSWACMHISCLKWILNFKQDNSKKIGMIDLFFIFNFKIDLHLRKNFGNIAHFSNGYLIFYISCELNSLSENFFIKPILNKFGI
jgi:hypothetical protein